MKAIYLSRSAVVGRPRLGMPSITALACIFWPSGRRKTWTIILEISRLAVEAKKPREWRLFSTLTRSTSSTTSGARGGCASDISDLAFREDYRACCCEVYYEQVYKNFRILEHTETK